MRHRPPPNPSSPTAVISVVLAFAAGATDAFAFLQLNGVFTANMTGNLILAGLINRPDYGTAIAGIIAAILVFAATVFLATRYAAPGRAWRPVVLLAISGVAQTTVLLLWAFGATGVGVMGVALVSLSTVAMACQTSVARRIDTASGVTTTYVTGTLTNLMADAAECKPQQAGIRIGVILALVAGALAGAVLLHLDTVYGAALPVLAVITATFALTIHVGRLHRTRSTSSKGTLPDD
ncbi:DUF1275 family protein [Microbacterium sp. CIAB417]|uniref:DUF1275 family protein n=1 Tax=Microbacterium sp. CIAB417 TaxID=2860287 RepID=UPI001FADB5AC|nr:YoaK family protein [Microbacterium sp. CIAB417]